MDAETTMCWRCSTVMGFTEPKCPKCGATNANVDSDSAFDEVLKSIDGATNA